MHEVVTFRMIVACTASALRLLLHCFATLLHSLPYPPEHELRARRKTDSVSQLCHTQGPDECAQRREADRCVRAVRARR